MNKVIVILALVGVIVAIIVAGMFVTASESNDPESTGSRSSGNAEESEQDDKITYYDMDETIEFATQDFKVNSAELLDEITDEYSGPYVPGEGAKVLLVNQTVTNTASSEYRYKPAIVIIDGDTYTSSDEASRRISYEESMEHRKISPNVPETGSVAYVVPGDGENYYIGGYKSGTEELHLIKLDI